MATNVEPFNSMSLGFIEGMYDAYLENPEGVPEDYRAYFASMGTNGQHAPTPSVSHDAEPPVFAATTPQADETPKVNGLGGGVSVARPAVPLTTVKAEEMSAGEPSHGAGENMATLQHRLDILVRNFRVRGHRMARVAPLSEDEAPNLPELDLKHFGFTDDDMERSFLPGTLMAQEAMSLQEIIERLQDTYCRSIGVQFMHIDDLQVREWLQERMETTGNRITLSRDQQFRILRRLTDAVIFEEFIQKKYTGAKSFSLEGAESLIPLLELTIEKAGALEIDEIVIGMAHRGRLNVLANIMGKSPHQIFREFEDLDPELSLGRGDVKYHLGYHINRIASNGHKVFLALSFNPSHLEYVNPVVSGRARARMDRLGDDKQEKSMVLLIHGDSAFAGEGIVQEYLNMSQLPAYRTGGTLHVIINNQIGFTTSPGQYRSSVYASDIAKVLQVPIFHVNGEDPEAVAQVINLSMDFRRQFQRDVVVDMYCYRRRGHNEGDEPSFTQPRMYAKIQKRPSVRESYLNRLLSLGEVTREEADQIAESRRHLLEEELNYARREDHVHTPTMLGTLAGQMWDRYKGGPEGSVPDVDTGIDIERARTLLKKTTKLPEGFTLHPKLKRFMKFRREMAKGERALDWSAGEALAFASIATDGYPVRLTGQDSERGTFSHRHSVVHDYESGERYMPLANLSKDQGFMAIHNSPLSESGVLGFEYGYSVGYPDALVCWEAQFGDFCNVAQPIIDQFIASAEDKWRRLSGLVMLLPHGFEGMGPEHSSARLERFLTLCAEDNLQVCNPTTPAQLFHLLRRQVVRPWRKPLIVMTPKSLLRHPKAVSPLEDFTTGQFQRTLPDTEVNPEEVTRILMCSGKLYYELVATRDEAERRDVAVIRLEQLYPLSDQVMAEALAPYKEGTQLFYVQEEPENMGAWRYLHYRFRGGSILGKYPFDGVYRPSSASPATGSASSHKLEQQALIERALNCPDLV